MKISDNKKMLRNNIIKKTILLVLFIIFVVFLYRCPIRTLLNIECPGCGLKRAFIYAVRLDFSSAFKSHPLFWLLGTETIYIILISYFPKLRINKKAEFITGVITLILLGIVWIYKILTR